jgi:hypothetical protein
MIMRNHQRRESARRLTGSARDEHLHTPASNWLTPAEPCLQPPNRGRHRRDSSPATNRLCPTLTRSWIGQQRDYCGNWSVEPSFVSVGLTPSGGKFFTPPGGSWGPEFPPQPEIRPIVARHNAVKCRLLEKNNFIVRVYPVELES